jgi:2-oxoisovalerate dehydrogenase E1 component
MPAVTETRTMTYIEAVNVALRTELQTDPSDARLRRGRGLRRRHLRREPLPAARFRRSPVFDMPIAENAILGSAVGAAISGMKPIVEIMWADFHLRGAGPGGEPGRERALHHRRQDDLPDGDPHPAGGDARLLRPAFAVHRGDARVHVPGVKVALAASATDAYALLARGGRRPGPGGGDRDARPLPGEGRGAI